MAVNGVDLEVRAGEIVVIAGVQGNGQTELVEAIAGLRSFDSGEASIGGQSIEKASARARSRTWASPTSRRTGAATG